MAKVIAMAPGGRIENGIQCYPIDGWSLQRMEHEGYHEDKVVRRDLAPDQGHQFVPQGTEAIHSRPFVTG
jgi:hypothetical protein